MPGWIAHIAVNADDDATRAFYAGVFGWTFEDTGMAGFTRTHTPAGPHPPIAAIQERRELVPGLRLNAPEVTIGVDDLDATIRAVPAHGGTIVMPRTVIGGVGALAFARDPSGNVIGMIEYGDDGRLSG